MDEWQDHIARGVVNLDDLGAIPSRIGDAVQERMQRLAKHI